jgi:exodeoxyribonuclease-3
MKENMRQLFFDEYLRKKDGKETLDKVVSQIKIINWNIAHPSLARAKRIAVWLESQDANISVFTETSDSLGCTFLRNRLESLGFKTIFLRGEKDFGAILVFRGFEAQEFNIDFRFLPHRVPAIICQTPLGNVGIIGVYVPSSVSRNEVNGKKERFQREFTEMLFKLKGTNLIVCGDLNVLEPNHKPHYSFLRSWEYRFYESFEENELIDAFRLFYPGVDEYSWYGREGYGYRYDHCFVSRELKKYTKLCQYIHEPRKNRLSDHSAMILELDVRNAGLAVSAGTGSH